MRLNISLLERRARRCRRMPAIWLIAKTPRLGRSRWSISWAQRDGLVSGLFRGSDRLRSHRP